MGSAGGLCVKVKTSRFGELQVDKNDILKLQDGILGFEHLKRFFIVDPGDSTLILWLQSLDDESVAFPVLEPKIFCPDYVVRLLPSELQSMEIEGVNEAKIYSILTIPKNVTQMSANLKAPIVVNPNKKLARQIVLQDSKLSVRHEMYKDLKQYIVNFTSDDAKRTRVSDPTSIETNTATTDARPRKDQVEI